MMVNICTKFHENILNGIRVIERTLKLNGRTDGCPDRGTDGRHNRIRPVFDGRIKMIFELSSILPPTWNLTISNIDRMILNLRGLFQERDLAVLQSKFIDDSNGRAQCPKRTLGIMFSPFLALIIPYKL